MFILHCAPQIVQLVLFITVFTELSKRTARGKICQVTPRPGAWKVLGEGSHDDYDFHTAVVTGYVFWPLDATSGASWVDRVKSETQLKRPRVTILSLRSFAHAAAELSQRSLKLAICSHRSVAFFPFNVALQMWKWMFFPSDVTAQ